MLFNKRIIILLLAFCFLGAILPGTADATECAHYTSHLQQCENAPEQCTHSCKICPVQNMVNDLPDFVNSRNLSQVRADVSAVETAMETLSAEELSQLDLSRYENTVRLMEAASVVFAVQVRVSGGETVEVNASSQDTLEILLEQLSSTGIFLSDPVIRFQDEILSKDQTLASCHITSGSVLELTNRYPVTVESCANGSVSLEHSSYEPLDVVTLKVNPSAGYRLSSMDVTMGDGSLCVEGAAGRYQFVMPQGAVLVRASFSACVHADVLPVHSDCGANHSSFYSCCGLQIQASHDFSGDGHRCVCGAVEQFTVSLWKQNVCLSAHSYPYGTVIPIQRYFQDGYVLVGFSHTENGPLVTEYDRILDTFCYTVTDNTSLYAVFRKVCDCKAIFPDLPGNAVIGESYTVSVAVEMVDVCGAGEVEVTYSLSDGSLPENWRLDTKTGIISGMPARAGSHRFTITAVGSLDSAHGILAQRTYDLTVSKRTVTVQAEDQQIPIGSSIEQTAWSVTGLMDGDTVSVLLTPSTDSITEDGSIQPSVTITSVNGAPEERYTVLCHPGKLVIHKDTARFIQLTKENVTSADEVYLGKLLAELEGTQDQEVDIDKCRMLLAEICRIREQRTTLSQAVDGVDAAKITSQDRENLEKLKAEIQSLLDGSNLTQAETEQTEQLLNRVQTLLDTLEKVSTDLESARNTIDSMNSETVKSSNMSSIDAAVRKMDAILESDNLTDSQRESIEQTKQKADRLLRMIQAAKNAPITENTEAVKEITPDTVKPEDQASLEQAKVDLQVALAQYAGNYTQAEQEQILQRILQIEQCLEAIDRAKAVSEAIYGLPDTVEPDDEETVAAIAAVKESLDGLTENERSMVESQAKEKLLSLLTAMTDYQVIQGANSKWTKGTSNTLTFTVNGPLSKFIGVEIDGKEVSSLYFTTKSGSTIVTIRYYYLRSLAFGKHSIRFLYSDGSAQAVFHTQDRSASPATGDLSQVGIWTAGLIASGSSLGALLFQGKKKKR